MKEKRLKRGQLIEQMRAIQKKADDEKRALSAEEQAEWDRIDAEQDELRAEIETEEKDVARRARLASLERDAASTPGSATRPSPIDGAGSAAGSAATPAVPTDARAYQDLYNAYLRSELSLGEVRARLQGPELRAELRADPLQVGLFVKGGALVMPQQMVAGLIQAVDNTTFMLGVATVERITQAESLGIGTLDTDVEDAEWTAELKTGSDTDLSVGKRELRPHAMAKRVKVSNTLLRRTAGGAGALVNQRLAYKVGITFEKGCLTGAGARQPLGVFTASDDGIPTSRDVATGNAADAIVGDGLIEAKYSLKAPYWRNAAWMFSRTAVKQIRKLKTGDGQYIWAPGLAGGTPDRILDLPFYVSEYVPATFTSGQYVGIVGDFKAGYMVVIAMDPTIQILDQLYAETNKTGFLARMEADGAPVLAEAFARVKLG
jgi:HK97 family phage major capsid protein